MIFCSALLGHNTDAQKNVFTAMLKVGKTNITLSNT